MHIRCPHCGSFVRTGPAVEPTDPVPCGFCGVLFHATGAQLRASRHALAAEVRREKLRPVDILASLTVFIVTAGVLLGLFTTHTPGDPFAAPWIWIFAGWTAALTLTAWVGYRTDGRSFLPSLFQTSVILLVVLVTPLLFRSLPTGIDSAAKERRARQTLVVGK